MQIIFSDKDGRRTIGQFTDLDKRAVEFMLKNNVSGCKSARTMYGLEREGDLYCLHSSKWSTPTYFYIADEKVNVPNEIMRAVKKFGLQGKDFLTVAELEQIGKEANATTYLVMDTLRRRKYRRCTDL